MNNKNKFIIVKSRPFQLDIKFSRYGNYVKKINNELTELVLKKISGKEIEFGKEQSVDISYSLANKQGFKGTFCFVAFKNEEDTLIKYAEKIKDDNVLNCESHDELFEYLEKEHGGDLWDFCIDDYSEISINSHSVQLVCFEGECRYYETSV